MKEEPQINARSNAALRVDKDLDTSDMDIPLEDEEQTPFRSMIEKFLITQRYAVYIEFITSFLSLITTTFHVGSTYSPDSFTWLDPVDITVCCIFSIDYLLTLYISQHRMQLILSLSSLLDLFIILSDLIFIGSIDEFISSLFVGASRLFRIIKFVKYIPKRFQIGDTDVNRQLMTIAFTLLSIIYIAAGLFQIVENDRREEGTQLNFLHAVYFVVVTVTTVGYGDILPETEGGKITVIASLVVGLELFCKVSFS